ncbi:anti-sigma factor [Kistimonas asteriae]|uniref:anti-sigma factor n=1 Tax=Kistimonas asteriae TaxID=517724 RepID=UPI001BA519C2|nr:anti-sigma factor [Kistimonas asteriae]
MSEYLNLSDPEQRNQAAADYVLGLLDQREKAAFEALLSVSHDAQREVALWRECLDILNQSLPPVTPPDSVWKAVCDQTRPPGHWWDNLLVWKSAAAGLFGILLVVGLLFLRNPYPAVNSDYVYVVQGNTTQPEWIVNASLSTNTVSMNAIQPVDLPNGQVCELWLMLKGQEPVSLGVLPKHGVKTVEIDAAWRDRLAETPLVITVESPQGAPSGYQMGTMVNQGEWVPVNKSI